MTQTLVLATEPLGSSMARTVTRDITISCCVAAHTCLHTSMHALLGPQGVGCWDMHIITRMRLVSNACCTATSGLCSVQLQHVVANCNVG